MLCPEGSESAKTLIHATKVPSLNCPIMLGCRADETKCERTPVIAASQVRIDYTCFNRRPNADFPELEMAKRYEVELKFPLAQNHAIDEKLRQRGAVEKPAVHHVDRYFNHPSRDFRSTDEAFRIRSVGDENCVTYKGAVLGAIAKTRHEIEIDFASGPDSATRFHEMVQMLGFQFVREVRKSRRSFSLEWNQSHFQLAIDEVPEIGCFLEIELLTEADGLKAAEAAVWELARSLELSTTEPRSYLDLLLERDKSFNP
jgi:adenylate cyclase class 2